MVDKRSRNSNKRTRRSPRTKQQHIDTDELNRQPQFDRPLPEILARLKDCVRTTDRWDCFAEKYVPQYSALCPAQNDHDKSLSVSETPNQETLIHCHAGWTIALDEIEGQCEILEGRINS